MGKTIRHALAAWPSPAHRVMVRVTRIHVGESLRAASSNEVRFQ